MGAKNSIGSAKRRVRSKEEEGAAFEKLVDQSLPVGDRLAAFLYLQEALLPSQKHTASYARELQRVYALRYNRWPVRNDATLLSLEAKKSLISSIRGLLFGTAVADACGLATEFLSKAAVQEYYGDSYSFCPGCDVFPDTHRINFARGDWTDDTDQSLLVLHSLLETGGVAEPQNFAQKLMKWREEGFTGLGDQGGVGLGLMTKAVLSSPEYAHSPIEVAITIWEQRNKTLAANGAVMRTAICGIAFYWDLAQVQSNTDIICRCTHADPRCRASCCIVTFIVAHMLQHCAQGRSCISSTNGLDVFKVMEEAVTVAAQYLDTSEEVEELQKYTSVRGKQFSDLQLDDAHSMGYTYKCLSCALLALSRASSLLQSVGAAEGRQEDTQSPQSHVFVKVIREIVQEGGDADTNAAVAGALLGCYLGVEAVPQRWLTAMPYTTWLEAWTQKLLFMMDL